MKTPCTRDPQHGPAVVPWSSEQLCLPCADEALDLLAKTVAGVFISAAGGDLTMADELARGSAYLKGVTAG